MTDEEAIQAFGDLQRAFRALQRRGGAKRSTDGGTGSAVDKGFMKERKGG